MEVSFNNSLPCAKHIVGTFLLTKNSEHNSKLFQLSAITHDIFFEDNNKIRNFDSIDQIIENNKSIKYDYLNSILFRKFIKEIIIAYSQVG